MSNAWLAAAALVAATLWLPAGVHHLGEWRRRPEPNYISLAIVALVIVVIVEMVVTAAVLLDRPVEVQWVAVCVIVVNVAASTTYLVALRWHKRKFTDRRER